MIARSPPGRGKWPLALALSGILLLAAVLRLHGIGFGLPALNDPDELMFELGATRMLTSGTLNPGWFGHPATTTMYVLAVVNAGTFGFGWMTGQYAGVDAFMQAIYGNPGIVILPGRLAIAAFGVLCVWQVFRLGRQLGGDESGAVVALVASLLLACSPQHVTYSQIIRSDMMGTLFMLLCLGSALRLAQFGRPADYRWAAVWLAMAVASKWPFALAVLGVLGAAGWRLTRPDADRMHEVRQLAGFAGLAVIALLVISPHLLLDFDTVMANLSGEARTQHLGATGSSLTENAWWYLRVPLREGLGVAGLVLALVGLVVLSGNRLAATVILPVIVGYALMICAHGLRWERWAMPMLPLFALAAGLAVAHVLQRMRQWKHPVTSSLAAMLAFAILPLSLASSAWTSAEVRTHDTRQQASVWAKTNIPPGSTVLIEHFAFDLFEQPWKILFPLGNAGCVDAHDMLAGRIEYRVVEVARAGRSNIDYGTLDPATRASCEADFAIITQMDRYRMEQQRFPQEYAAYDELVRRMRVAATFTPTVGEASGPTVEILSVR